MLPEKNQIIKVNKDKYIAIIEADAAWITYHIYYGTQVFVQKMPSKEFVAKYCKDMTEQLHLL